MIKFKIDQGIFDSLSVRVRQNLVSRGFKPSQKETLVYEVSERTRVEDYKLDTLALGEAYSIYGFPVMPIQFKAGRIKKQTGKVFTVNQKLGIVLRIS